MKNLSMIIFLIFMLLVSGCLSSMNLFDKKEVKALHLKKTHKNAINKKELLLISEKDPLHNHLKSFTHNSKGLLTEKMLEIPSHKEKQLKKNIDLSQNQNLRLQDKNNLSRVKTIDIKNSKDNDEIKTIKLDFPSKEEKNSESFKITQKRKQDEQTLTEELPELNDDMYDDAVQTTFAKCFTRLNNKKTEKERDPKSEKYLPFNKYYYYNLHNIKAINTTINDFTVKISLCDDVISSGCDNDGGLVKNMDKCTNYAGRHKTEKKWVMSSKYL